MLFLYQLVGMVPTKRYGVKRVFSPGISSTGPVKEWNSGARNYRFCRKLWIRTSEIITICYLRSQGIKQLGWRLRCNSSAGQLSLANGVHDFNTRDRRCFTAVDPVLDGYPKLVAIAEEANHQIVHGRRFSKANRTAHEPLDPRS